MVVEQNELQNECRSRETCSFGTPDAVVCKAARSASAVLAAVGPSVGIGARAGAVSSQVDAGCMLPFGLFVVCVGGVSSRGAVLAAFAPSWRCPQSSLFLYNIYKIQLATGGIGATPSRSRSLMDLMKNR